MRHSEKVAVSVEAIWSARCAASFTEVWSKIEKKLSAIGQEVAAANNVDARWRNKARIRGKKQKKLRELKHPAFLDLERKGAVECPVLQRTTTQTHPCLEEDYVCVSAREIS